MGEFHFVDKFVFSLIWAKILLFIVESCIYLIFIFIQETLFIIRKAIKLLHLIFHLKLEKIDSISLQVKKLILEVEVLCFKYLGTCICTYRTLYINS